MCAKVYPFELGDDACFVVQDHATVMPLVDLVANANLAELEQASRQLGLALDGVDVGYNCLLVCTGEGNVLVDAGYGLGLKGREGALVQSLRTVGIGADKIDRIVITHADRDHIGGILDERGEFVYPNARYVLWQGAWDFWQNQDNYREWPEEIVAIILGTMRRLEPRLELVGEAEQFLPGFEIVPAVGHRHDHVVLKISSRREQLLHLADAVVHPVFVERPDWFSTYDSVPHLALAVKKHLLELAASEGALVFGAHFPWPSLGHVTRRERGWTWLPVHPAE